MSFMVEECPNGTLMWCGGAYTVRFVVDVTTIVPIGGELLAGGMGIFVEKGTVIMFPNGDVVLHTGVQTQVVNCAGIQEIILEGDCLELDEKVFWRKPQPESEVDHDDERT